MGAGCILTSFLLLAPGSFFAWNRIPRATVGNIGTYLPCDSFLQSQSKTPHILDTRYETCWCGWIPLFFLMSLGEAFITTLLLACILPFLYYVILFVILDKSKLPIQPAICRAAGTIYESARESNAKRAAVLVYFSQYTMQSGM